MIPVAYQQQQPSYQQQVIYQNQAVTVQIFLLYAFFEDIFEGVNINSLEFF